METRQYDPLLVVLNVDGRDISGYADGTFVNMEYNEDAWQLTVGADGEATRAKSNNFSGRFTFTLQQSSPANDILDELAERDRISGTGAVPILLKDKNGTTEGKAEKGWVVKKAASGYAKNAENREWILETGQLFTTVGGQNAV